MLLRTCLGFSQFPAAQYSKPVLFWSAFRTNRTICCRDFEATLAQTENDVSVLNAGFGYYHFDAVDVWAATSIIWPIHAGIQLFG